MAAKTELRTAIDRNTEYVQKIQRAERVDRARLLDVWKQLITKQLAELLAVTDNIDLLTHLDNNIAVARDIHARRRSKKSVKRSRP